MVRLVGEGKCLHIENRVGLFDLFLGDTIIACPYKKIKLYNTQKIELSA